MKKLVLVLALALTLSVLSSSQTASADSPDLHDDCADDMQNDILLRQSEIYISDPLADLWKVEQANGSDCLIGRMSSAMTDLALDEVNEILYGIDDFPRCYSISRTTGTTTVIGFLHIEGLAHPVHDAANDILDLTAFEIDSQGRAWVAGELGNLYLMDLSNCHLTLKIEDMRTATAPLVTVSASGDLIWDIVNNNRLLLTAFSCEGCFEDNNGLYEINVNTWEVKFIADTGFEKVFAGDFVKGTQNICFVTNQGELFELNRTTGLNTMGAGVFKPTDQAKAYGGTALVDLVGGIGLDFDETALFLAAAQSNLLWASPFMLAGLGLVAFILAKKSSFKVKNKLE